MSDLAVIPQMLALTPIRINKFLAFPQKLKDPSIRKMDL